MDEKIERLREIQEELKELISEARHLFRGTTEADRFYSYSYAHMVGAIDKENEFLGGSFITMDDCINALERKEDNA